MESDGTQPSGAKLFFLCILRYVFFFFLLACVGVYLRCCRTLWNLSFHPFSPRHETRWLHDIYICMLICTANSCFYGFSLCAYYFLFLFLRAAASCNCTFPLHTEKTRIDCITPHMPEGPRVLLLGGLGMIGRNFLKYIADHELASYVCVADKKVPEMCFLTQVYKDLLALPYVEVVQVDLSQKEHVDRVFAGEPFSIIVNLASETRYGHLDVMYERSILQLRTLCAQKAARKGGCQRYVEVSTAQVYESNNKSPSKETGTRLKPWTTMAKYHLEAEGAVSSISQLPWVIVRLPIVYGPGDICGLMPRIVCAAVYEKSGTCMEFLWGKDLRIHTVHVQDVVAAMWHIVCAGAIHEVYNVVDDGDTTQGSLNAVLESMFKVKTGYFGALMSNLASLKLEELVEEANDGHMEPWTKMLREHGISVTPLSPYLEPELLYDNPLAVDGSKLRALGFRCSCPKVAKELLDDSLDYWVSLGLFPR